LLEIKSLSQGDLPLIGAGRGPGGGAGGRNRGGFLLGWAAILHRRRDQSERGPHWGISLQEHVQFRDGGAEAFAQCGDRFVPADPGVFASTEAS